MLDRTEPLKFETTMRPVDTEPTVDLADMLSFLSRYRYTVVGAVAGCILLASIYLLFAPVRYAASTQVLIGSIQSQAQPSPVAGVPDGTLDASAIESQVAIIKSGSVAQAVVNKLDLTKDKEFSAAIGGLLDSITGMFGQGASADSSPDLKQQIALIRLQRNLAVQREGISHVIDIEFRSTDKAKAARIANAIAEAYLTSQVEVRNEATRRANAWLEERLAVIKAETLASEKAVQDFKSQTKSLDAGATLLDLESRAQSQRRLYETFRERYLENSQQLSLPVVDARVITPAMPPLRKSEPRSTIVLAVALSFGLALGVALAFLRDRFAR